MSPSFNRLSRRRSGAGSGRGLHDRTTIAEVGMTLVSAKASYLSDSLSGDGANGASSEPRMCFPDVSLPYTAPHPTAAGEKRTRNRSFHDPHPAAHLFKRRRLALHSEASVALVQSIQDRAEATMRTVSSASDRFVAAASALMAWAQSAAVHPVQSLWGRGGAAAAGQPGGSADAVGHQGRPRSPPSVATHPSSALDTPLGTPQRFARTRLAALPSGCPARDVAWHPHFLQAAVALHDGTIAFFGLSATWEPLSSGSAVCGGRSNTPSGAGGGGSAGGAGVQPVMQPRESGGAMWPVLKHEFQKDISRIAWQPLSGSTLAVACRDGICVWRRKRRQHGKLSGGVAVAARWWCTFHPWQSPTPRVGDCNVGIGDLAWSPCGRCVACASSGAQAGLVVLVLFLFLFCSCFVLVLFLFLFCSCFCFVCSRLFFTLVLVDTRRCQIPRDLLPSSI